MREKGKVLAVLVCTLLAVGVTTGCAGQEPSSTPPSSQMAYSSSSNVGVPNPVVEYTAPDFTAEAGFAVEKLPEGYSLKRAALIGKTVAELELVPDGDTAQDAVYTLRIAVDTGDDISGVYLSDVIVSDQETNGVSVELRENQGGVAVASWVREGYRFSLYLENASAAAMEDLLDKLTREVFLSPPEAPTL